MRTVVWTDEVGRKRRSFLPDRYEDHMAEHGTPGDVPDLNRLNWEKIKLDLHNALTNRELFTYDDVIAQQNGVSGAILSALRGEVVALYKERRAR